jgi:segregation and condensation protein A
MQQLNMELASEFIYVAATLMRIKAKMLLPRYEVDEEGNEVDHKEDLIRKLIEYKKFKLICEELKPLEDERFKREKRGNIYADMEAVAELAAPGEELESFDLYKLMLAYERVLNRYQHAEQVVTHQVVQYPYTIEQQKQMIIKLIAINQRLDFGTLAKNSTNRVHFVYNFLALLEMLQEELIAIQIGLGYNNFWISAR